MGTHMRVLSERYLMNTNMTGFRRLSKIFASLGLVASALGGLKRSPQETSISKSAHAAHCVLVVGVS